MAINRKPFLPLDPDIVHQRMERLARDNGVGRLGKPASEGGEGEAVVSAVQVAASAPASIAMPASKLKTLNLELPDYVRTDLKIRAAQQQSSLKHVVMKALRKAGITIKDADMIEDGRRLRRSNKPH